MKTTIEIPDRLFRKAKSKAAERGQTLKEFMAEALREKLASNARDARPGEPAAYEACLNSQLSHFDILAVTEQTSVAFAATTIEASTTTATIGGLLRSARECRHREYRASWQVRECATRWRRAIAFAAVSRGPLAPLALRAGSAPLLRLTERARCAPRALIAHHGYRSVSL
jgi:hypothetical protein